MATKASPTKALRAFVARALAYQADRCLLWPFNTDGAGYGRVTIDGDQVNVHRYVCEQVHGAPPTRKHQAAHSCGRRTCANPRHLRWATVSENLIDALRHGTRGTLTERDVLELRHLHADGVTLSTLADRYSVNPTTISDAVAGRTWAHLPIANQEVHAHA